ncbi:MAG: 3-dehydroquinate synthase, partial [Lachnospiraceae bacterium]|nr:3-dehydroquinate synthase [Lachnospiraceae bacterium]
MKYANENRLIVHLNNEPIYDIVLTESFEGLSQELMTLGCEKKKLCIVTDSNVAPIYLEEIKNLVSRCCRMVTTYIIPAGEENKNLDTVRGVY